MKRLHIVFYGRTPSKNAIFFYESTAAYPVEKLRSNKGESAIQFFKRIGKTPQQLLDVVPCAIHFDHGPPPYPPNLQQNYMFSFWAGETLGAKRRAVRWGDAELSSDWLSPNPEELQEIANFCKMEVRAYRYAGGDSLLEKVCKPIRPRR